MHSFKSLKLIVTDNTFKWDSFHMPYFKSFRGLNFFKVVKFAVRKYFTDFFGFVWLHHSN